MTTQQPKGRGPDDLDFEIPTPIASRGARSATVAAAAAALAIAGLFAIAGAVLIAGAGPSGLTVALVAVFGAIQLAAAMLVFRLTPIGRAVGIAVATMGFVFGLARLIDGRGTAAIDIAAYAFVIWALATSREAFDRK